MKMSQAHFADVRNAMNRVLSAHSLATIAKHRETISFVHCQFTAFCWSIFHASRYDSGLLYAAGLSDRHIETAIKKILSNFA